MQRLTRAQRQHYERRRVPGACPLLWTAAAITAVLASLHGMDHVCIFATRQVRARIDVETIASSIEAYRLLSPTGLLPEPSAFPAILLDPGASGYPPLLDPDKLTRGRLLDPWGRDYAYHRLSVRAFEVVSYGQDGEPGGDGPNADVVVRRP